MSDKSGKTIDELEKEIARELYLERLARKNKKQQACDSEADISKYQKTRHEHKIEKQNEQLSDWKSKCYEKTHYNSQFAQNMFAKREIEMADVMQFLGIDMLYLDEAVKTFKRNQNRMKQILIEENAKQKKELESFIKESREYLTKIKGEFVENIRESQNMLNDAAKEFREECKKQMKTNLSSTEMQSKIKEINKRAQEEIESVAHSSLESVSAIKEELRRAISESSKDCKKNCKVYTNSLKQLYKRERELAERAAGMEKEYIMELESAASRLEMNTHSIVNEVITKRLNSSEIRYACQMKKLLKAIIPAERCNHAIASLELEDFVSKGIMHPNDLYNYILQNDMEEDRHYT